MVFFITFLRALAACLITNAHYTDVYPTDLIANGGLLGNILFFAVSGYCLSNVKGTFFQWYGKRLYRVYPPMFIITMLYGMIGAYHIRWENAFYWFVYPTYYHFVLSIVLLYIPFFLCMNSRRIKTNLVTTMGIVALMWLLLYVMIYDKTYYHIDAVDEPMIRFLFFEAMLLGAYFRENRERFENRFKIKDVFLTIVAAGAYFGSKIFFSRTNELVGMQFINQVAVFILLFALFKLIAGIDYKLVSLPDRIKRIICFIAEMTLEIYLVQEVLLKMKNYFVFPLNWMLLTSSILTVAWLLHVICKQFYRIMDKYIFRSCR